jgi:hypothetical protein
MKKLVVAILIGLSLVALAVRFGTKPLFEALGYQVKAGLKVNATPQATVFIDGQEVGKTPFQDENLKVGEYDLKLVSENFNWQGKVKLNQGTLSVVNRELGKDSLASGETLTLAGGSGTVITSSPSESEVEIDGKYYGKTPLSLADLKPGEHIFLIGHENYLKRSIKATLPGKLVLNIAVDLAASETPVDITPTKPTVDYVTIKDTPNGFLRVRNKPSLNGTEIGKVNTGDKLPLTEELSGWFKVKLEDGTEGYISSAYAVRK